MIKLDCLHFKGGLPWPVVNLQKMTEYILLYSFFSEEKAVSEGDQGKNYKNFLLKPGEIQKLWESIDIKTLLKKKKLGNLP